MKQLQKCRSCFGKGKGFDPRTGTWDVCSTCKGTGKAEVESNRLTFDEKCSECGGTHSTLKCPHVARGDF